MSSEATDFEGLLTRLLSGHVRFIIVGGVAATVHGSAHATYDLDVVYDRSQDNIARLVDALAPLQPYLRDAPAGLPFVLSAETVRAGLNFTLRTTLGDLDLFGEIIGGGTYGQLLPDSDTLSVFGYECRCLSLRKLIEVKRAAGRPKDFDAIAALEALDDERSR